MTASRCLAATSGDCTLRLVFPKGDDSGVSTVPGMECDANRFRLPAPELNGSGSHELIERGLGGPVAVPAAQVIVADAADPGRQCGEHSLSLARQQGKHVLHDQGRPDRVEREGTRNLRRLKLVPAFFRTVSLSCRKPVASTTTRIAP